MKMSNVNGPSPAIFVDRDGTLIEEVDHLSSVDDLRIFPFTREALEIFKARGVRVIVLTNQSGIARGYFTEGSMQAIHDKIKAELGTLVDSFYFCPHLPDAGCSCRKPNVGMIEAASEDFEIDLAGSWMIGDKRIDVETGQNAGIGTALVLTGYGTVDQDRLAIEPTIVAKNLLEAAKLIVNGSAAH